ncbi:hypothetical protein ymoll0001_5970 [Yersinia mollaretii ATCC 43969]|uniref:Uncharacterized protein n=1 Tax=Yersinia mollaretii (strain ATCC 43969 / DSM 18520 / CIP 103324 / CNY 7263 / WAIP 204) TaxID=349967 RepID=A0ABM9Y4V8_YERMW|nr:hypothetical protein ymoll0001_5970 [Yersinia mollaretii ATCC 43969]
MLALLHDSRVKRRWRYDEFLGRHSSFRGRKSELIARKIFITLSI